jgi:hypothetical protein
MGSPLFLFYEAGHGEPGFWAETRFITLEERAPALHLFEEFRAFEFALQTLDARADAFAGRSSWDLRALLEREIRAQRSAWRQISVAMNAYAPSTFQDSRGAPVVLHCFWMIIDSYWAICFFIPLPEGMRLMVASPYGPDIDDDALRVAQMNAREIPNPPHAHIERFIRENV